jgi:hypothetical protein
MDRDKGEMAHVEGASEIPACLHLTVRLFPEVEGSYRNGGSRPQEEVVGTLCAIVSR